jgi:hypothetical protein
MHVDTAATMLRIFRAATCRAQALVIKRFGLRQYDELKRHHLRQYQNMVDTNVHKNSFRLVRGSRKKIKKLVVHLIAAAAAAATARNQLN